MTNENKSLNYRNTGNDWNEWSRHVFAELERLAKSSDECLKEFSKIENSMIKIESKLTEMENTFNYYREHCSESDSDFDHKLYSLNDTIIGSNDNPGIKSRMFICEERIDKIQKALWKMYAFISTLTISVLSYIIINNILK